jgi:hypothetical protein
MARRSFTGVEVSMAMSGGEKYTARETASEEG